MKEFLLWVSTHKAKDIHDSLYLLYESFDELWKEWIEQDEGLKKSIKFLTFIDNVQAIKVESNDFIIIYIKDFNPDNIPSFAEAMRTLFPTQKIVVVQEEMMLLLAPPNTKGIEQVLELMKGLKS